MSTGLTMPPMVDSLALRLLMAGRAYQERVAERLAADLAARGYPALAPAQLAFLAELDCGVNHAADLARRLGVSRQAMHKQVAELAARGLLGMRPDAERRNRNVIVFTEAGVALIAECRRILAEIDAELLRAAPGDPERLLALIEGAARRG